jgi:hypothetical protein
MSREHALIPEFDWLAASADVDDSWLGPGPKLVNLRPWLERLSATGHRTIVVVAHAAAKAAQQHWDAWLEESPDVAMESILDGRPPTEQLAAVSRWLNSQTAEHKSLAFDTVDHTKQLHWFHEEYCDVWFDEPGMWAIESSEYCVLSLTGDPYSEDSAATLATLSVACAVNSFRKSATHDIRGALSVVVESIRRQLG